MLAATLIVSGGSAAWAVCGPSEFEAVDPGGPLPFELEGPLTAADAAARTLTVNGMVISVPLATRVETGVPGDIELDCLLDPNGIDPTTALACFPAGSVPQPPRPAVGGTVISTGSIDFRADADSPTGACAQLTANSVFFEFAENVALGILTVVTPPSFSVNGLAVQVNPDPRLPANILDASGNPITVADLAGFEGTAISVEGYFDATVGSLFAVLAETMAFAQNPGVDTVVIERAQYRADRGAVRVRGFVTPMGAETVEVFIPGAINATSDGCDGTSVGEIATVPAEPAGGAPPPDIADYEFRGGGFGINPGMVCVLSAGGGVEQREFEVR